MTSNNISGWLPAHIQDSLAKRRAYMSAAKRDLRSLSGADFARLMGDHTRAIDALTQTLGGDQSVEATYMSLVVPEAMRRAELNDKYNEELLDSLQTINNLKREIDDLKFRISRMQDKQEGKDRTLRQQHGGLMFYVLAPRPADPQQVNEWKLWIHNTRYTKRYKENYIVAREWEWKKLLVFGKSPLGCPWLLVFDSKDEVHGILNKLTYLADNDTSDRESGNSRTN